MYERNRSPCPLSAPLVLQEHAAPAAQAGIRLSERLQPDRGNAALREETRAGQVVTLVDVTVATAGRINRNFRLYPREVWQAAIDAAQPDLEAGKLWGLVEHPDDSWLDCDPLKGRLENIWVLYEKLWLDGDTVRATGVLIETGKGGDMKALLRSKLAVGISSNGLGSVQYLPAKEVLDAETLATFPDPELYVGVIQSDFRLLTIDAVSDPSDTAGSARQREKYRPQEGHMHKFIKEWLASKPGLTLEQAKAQFAAEYVAVLEKIAQEGAQDAAPVPAPAAAPSITPPAPAAPATHAESTLEQNLLALNTRLEASERAAFTERRTSIAITALEAAQLPRAPKVGDLDLDARFREQLTTASITAQSDDEARALVDQMVQERRALMGAAQARPGTVRTESAFNRAGGTTLPVGNSSAPARTFEGLNPIAGVRSAIGLK